MGLTVLAFRESGQPSLKGEWGKLNGKRESFSGLFSFFLLRSLKMEKEKLFILESRWHRFNLDLIPLQRGQRRRRRGEEGDIKFNFKPFRSGKDTTKFLRHFFLFSSSSLYDFVVLAATALLPLTFFCLFAEATWNFVVASLSSSFFTPVSELATLLEVKWLSQVPRWTRKEFSAFSLCKEQHSLFRIFYTNAIRLFQELLNLFACFPLHFKCHKRKTWLWFSLGKVKFFFIFYHHSTASYSNTREKQQTSVKKWKEMRWDVNSEEQATELNYTFFHFTLFSMGNVKLNF